ncbi:hypothetical protein H0266_06795 [Halobacillus locisalis]|uniref:PH domain-containing protein n=1 Tax=Halobacillus locisalis TaxID=220753 RepID=A0A838CSN1_9BACI|nr:hypothetical protein [Halobacillus locisalis]
MIYSQPVIHKKRVIENNRQYYLEEHLSLDLYDDQVLTPTESIDLRDLHDVSYKSFSGDQGLLYLHTNKGVRTFLVQHSPIKWIEAVKSQSSG